MRDDFVALILTNGRPDNIKTLKSMARAGYTGAWLLVVDDEDPTLDRYREVHGEERVVTFSKAEAALAMDEGDNFPDRRSVVYARNASFQIARDHGFQWFIQLDDDYTQFYHRFHGDLSWDQSTTNLCDLDKTWSLIVEFMDGCPPIMKSVAMGQGGDYVGGHLSGLAVRGWRQKAMNSFVCSVDRPFMFPGKLNEDVNAYTQHQRPGTAIFLTLAQVALIQTMTQANEGGMSDMYRDSGTYVKSWYSVMRCPSAVKVSALKTLHTRIHHSIRFNHVTPKILRETHRVPR